MVNKINMNAKTKCEVCGYKISHDTHHFGKRFLTKNGKTITRRINRYCLEKAMKENNVNEVAFRENPSIHKYEISEGDREFIVLCPNHHAILHRLLKDVDGTNFNSKEEIIKSIKEIDEK